MANPITKMIKKSVKSIRHTLKKHRASLKKGFSKLTTNQKIAIGGGVLFAAYKYFNPPEKTQLLKELCDPENLKHHIWNKHKVGMPYDLIVIENVHTLIRIHDGDKFQTIGLSPAGGGLLSTGKKNTCACVSIPDNVLQMLCRKKNFFPYLLNRIHIVLTSKLTHEQADFLNEFQEKEAAIIEKDSSIYQLDTEYCYIPARNDPYVNKRLSRGRLRTVNCQSFVTSFLILGDGEARERGNKWNSMTPIERIIAYTRA